MIRVYKFNPFLSQFYIFLNIWDLLLWECKMDFFTCQYGKLLKNKLLNYFFVFPPKVT